MLLKINSRSQLLLISPTEIGNGHLVIGSEFSGVSEEIARVRPKSLCSAATGTFPKRCTCLLYLFVVPQHGPYRLKIISTNMVQNRIPTRTGFCEAFRGFEQVTSKDSKAACAEVSLLQGCCDFNPDRLHWDSVSFKTLKSMKLSSLVTGRACSHSVTLASHGSYAPVAFFLDTMHHPFHGGKTRSC